LTAIARTAARLCDANDASIYVRDGDSLRLAAKHGSLRSVWAVGESNPLTRGLVTGRAVLDTRTIHVHDMARSIQREFPGAREFQRRAGVRTELATPLLLSDTAIGCILIRRTRVRPFTPKQITLLKTFADQAAIAIENARLSEALQARNRELTGTLEQQTATSGILRVISGSPTDIQPVFEAIVRSALRLCDAEYTGVFRFDGGLVHVAAHNHTTPEARQALHEAWPQPLASESLVVRAIRERSMIHVSDVQADPATPPSVRARSRLLGQRSFLVVPMLRDGEPVGAIRVARTEPAPFTDKQIALLQTFADQAVIAIENARLFKALEVRNAELSEALEQQTATADILRVISSSPTDLAPVFDAILERATRLCDAHLGVLGLYDVGRYGHVAHRGASPEFQKWLFGPAREQDPVTGLGRMIRERQPIHIPDLTQEPAYRDRNPARVATVEIGGARTFLAVPMLKEDRLVDLVDKPHGQKHQACPGIKRL